MWGMIVKGVGRREMAGFAFESGKAEIAISGICSHALCKSLFSSILLSICLCLLIVNYY